MSPFQRRKLLPFCIAASLYGGFSGSAAAVGLGEIHLQSFLGAPLQAEVPLNHLGDLTPDQLKIKIGSESDYTALGVEFSYLHSQLKIEPIVKNGQGYIRITSREPITEPYLNFVVNLHWPQGQVVREFTVLLDPVPNSGPVAAAAPAAETPAVAEIAPSRPARKARHAPAAEVAEAAAPAAAQPATPPLDGAYVTQRGDSLWRLANRLRPSAVPVEQMMAALHSANPQAFINGDPSRLKEAVGIAFPSAEQIAAASHGAMPTVASVPSRAAPVAAAATAVATAAAPAAMLVEENTALKQQVADLTTNVGALNQNLTQSEQRLHQLEAQLDELLKQFQQQRNTIASLSGNADVRSANGATAATGSMISQVNASELSPAPKAHTPWWVHLMYWLGIGGVAMLAVREHFWPQRRLATVGADNTSRRAAALPVANTWSEPPAVEPRARVAPVEAPQEIEELVLDLEPASAEDTPPQLLSSSEDPVDASISAGVFVAFGRFDEAERLLRQALQRAPGRADLQLQLLDVHMQADQREAFEALAEEIESGPASAETLAEVAVLRDGYRNRH